MRISQTLSEKKKFAIFLVKINFENISWKNSIFSVRQRNVTHQSSILEWVMRPRHYYDSSYASVSFIHYSFMLIGECIIIKARNTWRATENNCIVVCWYYFYNFKFYTSEVQRRHLVLKYLKKYRIQFQRIQDSKLWSKLTGYYQVKIGIQYAPVRSNNSWCRKIINLLLINRNGHWVTEDTVALDILVSTENL